MKSGFEVVSFDDLISKGDMSNCAKMCKLSEDILDEKWLLSSHQLKCCYISIEQLINRDIQLGDPYNTNLNYESTGCLKFVRL